MNKTVRNILIALVAAAILILATRYLTATVNLADLLKNMHG